MLKLKLGGGGGPSLHTEVWLIACGAVISVCLLLTMAQNNNTLGYDVLIR